MYRHQCLNRPTLALIFVLAVFVPALAWSATGPIAAYSFDEGGGTTLNDRSGNNHSGALTNGPVWSSGKHGGGLSFDGANDYVEFGDVTQAEGLRAITVSAWVKFAAPGGGLYETHFIDKSGCNGIPSSGPWELAVSISSSHKAEFVIYPQGASPSTYLLSGPSTTSIDDGNWHFITGVYDGVYLSIWVDGAQENAASYPGLTTTSSDYRMEMGGHCDYGYQYPFHGVLDDARIYGRALTAGEIESDMATPVGTISSPPPDQDTTPPSIPSGLHSTNVTSTQIAFSWQASTDNVGVAGYRIYRGGTQVGSTSSTNFTDSGLTPSTRYDYTVRAYDAAGNVSAASAALSVATSASSSGGSGSYSTSFGSNENPLSEGGKWIDGKAIGLDWNNPLSASGKALASVLSGATGSRYDDSIAHLSTAFQAFNPNQFAQATVYLANGYSARHEVELLLRFSVTNHDAHGYEVLWGLPGYLAVVRWNGPRADYTPIYDPGVGSIRVPRDGDVLRAEMNGNIITVKLNGNTVATVDVSSAGLVWTSGQPGIGFWPVDDAIPDRYGWKSFTAGNL